MKMHALALIALASIGLGDTVALHAYIYQVKTLRKWDTQRKQYRYFIGFSDFHDKAHPSNDDQRPTIEDLLKKINPNKYKVVVEDLCSLSNAATTKKVNFYIASKGGILAGLGDFCRTNNIPFENVEYRYCRVATMGPVINNLSASPHLFLSTRSIELGVLVDEIEQTLNSLASIPYPLLKKAYKEEARKIRTIFSKLKMNKHKNVSVADYIAATSTKENKIDVLKHLLTFDSGLLDIKLVAEVLDSPKNSIAFLGGTHIHNACELLKKLGYSEEKTFSVIVPKGKKNTNDFLYKSIGNKPKPLELAVIKDILNNPPS